MDIETFMQQTPPKALRSRLVPYTQQIALLKAKGYSNQQVLDWLAMNGIQISLEGLRIFINKYCKDPNGLTAAANTNAPPPAGQQRTSEPNPGKGGQGLTLRQKGEIEAAKYIKPVAISPLTQRLLDKRRQEEDDESGSD